MLEKGDIAPDFTLPRDGGGDITLSSLRPRRVVLYFYPKDDTPGCTTEALDFSGQIAAFEAADAVVLGVSKDGIQKHEKFRDKHDLKVALLSDEATDICERYGVWVEKNMYGKTYMGIQRSTFLIDGDGRIADIWRNVKVKGHVDLVLAAARDAKTVAAP